MVRISNKGSNGGGSERSRRRTEARRLDILRAAARIFRAKGFAAAGMRDIAAEADLSPGNLYYYFKGKDEILYFCQDRWLDQMLRVVRRESAGSGPLADALRRVLEAHVRYLLDELEGSAAHLEIDALPPDLRKRLVAKRDRYEREIRRMVADGIERGELGSREPTLVTRAMLGSLNWTARWFRPDGAQSAAEVAAGLADYLIGGLRVGRPRSTPSRRTATGGSR